MIIVIGISGKIASGKSTIADLISENRAIPIVRFGDYVRKIALENGISVSRAALQDLGQELVDTQLREFCFNVLFSSGWRKDTSLVIDGIRHVQVYNMIKELIYPLPIHLIFVTVSDVIRANRLTSDPNRLDHHKTEYDVIHTLKSVADTVINGDLPIPFIMEQIKALFT